MTRRVITLAALMLTLTSLLSCGRAETQPVPPETTIWEGLRSAIVYVRVSDSDDSAGEIGLDWTPAWISDAQRERLYWYDPVGNLVKRVEIERSQPSGSVSLPLAGGPGDYRLVIPGYSFRKYRVRVPGQYKSVIEPEKLHFSMEIGSGDSFWTGPLESARFHLKSHSDTAAFALTTQNGEKYAIAHAASGNYRDHEALDLEFQNTQAKLTVTDGGKFSFWLDNAQNVFAQTSEGWFQPNWESGKAVFTVSDRVIGETTEVGTYTEFAPLPEDLTQLLRDTRPSIIHSYIFEDVMPKHVARDAANNRALLQLGVRQLYGLLSRTTRDSLPKSASKSAQFLDTYLRRRFAEDLPLHIVAFVDEPNLRYRSYEAYEAYHLALAQTVRSVSETLGVQLEIAAPESSRMVNGPTNKPRRFQTGFSWTQKLLNRHWHTVDVISWHMWQYRYLEALDQYPETIEQVYQLNARLAQKADDRPKDLSISQTNLGSGPNTSTYQQNTHYAGLWWASVVSQSINTGKLDSLIWFKAVDEGPYGKGLLEPRQGQLARKPIANAMIFINETLLPSTLEAKSTAHEVNIAAMRSASGETNLLCVNKSRRDYSVFLYTAGMAFDTIDYLGADESITTSALSEAQQDGSAPILIPAETICRFRGLLFAEKL